MRFLNGLENGEQLHNLHQNVENDVIIVGYIELAGVDIKPGLWVGRKLIELETEYSLASHTYCGGSGLRD